VQPEVTTVGGYLARSVVIGTIGFCRPYLAEQLGVKNFDFVMEA